MKETTKTEEKMEPRAERRTKDKIMGRSGTDRI